MARSRDTIRVAVEVGRDIVVNARGKPARTVAVSAAAGVAMVAAAVGYGAYRGAKRMAGKSG